MSKKGATQSGGTAGRQRAKDQAMAAQLPPAPATWNPRAAQWPYHNNLNAGKRRGRPNKSAAG